MIKKLMSAAVVAAVVSAPVAIADEFEDQIEARQAVMTLSGYNMGILSAMVKGKMDYDATLAQEAANNMLAVSKIKAPSMWPAGSDNSKVEGTKAKPEGWANYEDVMAKQENWMKAAQAMADSAGNGLDGVKSSIGALGKSCKACHSEYKAR